jgi:hypothetical protein
LLRNSNSTGFKGITAKKETNMNLFMLQITFSLPFNTSPGVGTSIGGKATGMVGGAILGGATFGRLNPPICDHPDWMSPQKTTKNIFISNAVQSQHDTEICFRRLVLIYITLQETNLFLFSFC